MRGVLDWTSPLNLGVSLIDADDLSLHNCDCLKQLLHKFISTALRCLDSLLRLFHFLGPLNGDLRKVFQSPDSILHAKSLAINFTGVSV